MRQKSGKCTQVFREPSLTRAPPILQQPDSDETELFRPLSDGVARLLRLYRSSPLARDGSRSLFIQAHVLPLKLLGAVVMARVLGPSGYGMVNLMIAAVAVLQVVPQGGIDNAVLRFGAQYAVAGEWGRLRGLLRTGVLLSLACGLVTALGLWAWGEFGQSTPMLRALVYATIPLACLLPLDSLLAAAMQATGHGVASQVPRGVLRPWVFYLALFACLAWLPRWIVPPQVLLLQALATLGSAAAAAWLFARLRPGALATAPVRCDLRTWWGSALSYGMLSGLIVINMQVDLLMVGWLAGTHDVGLYRIATQAAALVGMPLGAADAFIAARIVRFHQQGDRAGLQRLLALSAASTSLLAVLAALAMAIWGRSLIGAVFGQVYAPAYPSMLVLCLAQLLNVAFGSVSLVLGMTGAERVAARVTAVGLALNLALNLVLIPIWGALGAAIATCTAMVVWNLLMLWQVTSRLAVDASLLGALRWGLARRPGRV